MALRKPLEANDGSYGGIVLAAFDEAAGPATPEELLAAVARSHVDHKDEVIVTIDVDRCLWDAIRKFRRAS